MRGDGSESFDRLLGRDGAEAGVVTLSELDSEGSGPDVAGTSSGSDVGLSGPELGPAGSGGGVEPALGAPVVSLTPDAAGELVTDEPDDADTLDEDPVDTVLDDDPDDDPVDDPVVDDELEVEAPLDGDEFDDDELVVDDPVSESVDGSADASPWPVSAAAPIPNATARPPIRPM